jgi:hypothetical protein
VAKGYHKWTNWRNRRHGMATQDIWPYIHSPECVEKMQASRLAREAWLSTYPDYCRKCDARGYHIRHHSDGIFEFNDLEDCVCIEEQCCPRCGAQDVDLVDDPCPLCGWCYGLEGGEVPPESRCTCGVDKIEHYEGSPLFKPGWANW